MKNQLIAELEKYIDPDRASQTERFFGIYSGGYGEGDILLGISATIIRKICREYRKMDFTEIEELLQSRVHEYRFAALVLLTTNYKKHPSEVVDIVLRNLKYINNWDLVDCFMPHIIGANALENHDESLLQNFNDSNDLWIKRISIVSYLAFYRKHVLGNGLENIDKLLEDKHHLIQKANGWMLREIYSKVDKNLIENYLIDNYSRLPRTSLRYAIEKMPENERQKYLKGEF